LDFFLKQRDFFNSLVKQLLKSIPKNLLKNKNLANLPSNS